MDRPTDQDKKNLKSLPKPIQLNLPTTRPKPARRLHEPDPERPSSHNNTDRPKPPPKAEPPKQERTSGKRYFDSAQKAYGQRRPRQQPKPKPKRSPRQWEDSGPILGQGDRLYTPPQPRRPLFPPHVRRVLRFWALGLIGIAFLVMGLINLFSYNAWAVYLDQEFLGYMPINREIETYTIHNDAVQQLIDLLGADVEVNETATVRTSRARRREVSPAPDMIRHISQSFTYQVIASVIYVDGDRVAVLRNESDALHVAEEIKRRFINEHTLPDMTTFEEEWRIVRMPTEVDLDEMDSPAEVIQLLERPIRDIHQHIIRSGDTQGALAVEFNTTVDRIGYLNDITADAILRVGDLLLIEISRPRLTVRTVDEITSLEVIPREVEIRENPNLHVSVETEIQEGRDGEVQIRQRITRLNGVQMGAPVIVYNRELIAPVDRIVEVGTSETALEVR